MVYTVNIIQWKRSINEHNEIEFGDTGDSTEFFWNQSVNNDS